MNDLTESIRQSMARMKARHLKKEALNKLPDCACKKCRSTYWEKDLNSDWYCFICGNHGHWEDGEFVQSNRS